ncbi:MAG: hypothetical protein ACOCUV_02755 [bacterium]
MPKNDLLWKSILEQVFEDFILFFYPASKEIFDFEQGVTFLDKELQQLFPPEKDQANASFVDKLVQVPMLAGDNQWVLVHIEIQGTPEKLFERRMFRYYSRIFDKYDKQITAFAVFTDKDTGFHPTKYANEFLGTSLLYQFNTLKILDQSIEELKKNSNPFACVLLAVLAAVKGRDQGTDFTFSFKKELFLEFERRNMANNKKKAILAFLYYYVNIGSVELEKRFNDELKIFKDNYNMSLDEAIKELELEKLRNEERERIRIEEREKTTQEIVKKHLLSQKFSIAEISQITGTSEGYVLQIKSEL